MVYEFLKALKNANFWDILLLVVLKCKYFVANHQQQNWWCWFLHLWCRSCIFLIIFHLSLNCSELFGWRQDPSESSLFEDWISRLVFCAVTVTFPGELFKLKTSSVAEEDFQKWANVFRLVSFSKSISVKFHFEILDTNYWSSDFFFIEQRCHPAWFCRPFICCLNQFFCCDRPVGFQTEKMLNQHCLTDKNEGED